MRLYEEILCEAIRKGVLLTHENAQVYVHDTACQTLEKIKLILEEDQLDDQECFWKIEAIVRAFEEIGGDGGNRHDFG